VSPQGVRSSGPVQQSGHIRRAPDPRASPSTRPRETRRVSPLCRQTVSYNIYRGEYSSGWPGAHSYACLLAALLDPGCYDSDLPPAGASYYYLATGRNCFGEGTNGAHSAGAPRPMPAACP
jgi:hypothetical protein